MKFTLVMVGNYFEGLIDADNRKYVEVWPWVPFAAHSYRMMCLGLGAAIIPLADLPFNDYKSPIKLMGMAAMGVPSVVADVGSYKAASREINSIAYLDAHGFYTGIRALLTDPQLRARWASGRSRMCSSTIPRRTRIFGRMPTNLYSTRRIRSEPRFAPALVIRDENQV